MGKLALIGLGLGDEYGVTLRGLNLARSCDVIYLEMYTGAFLTDFLSLEKVFERKVNILYRDSIEGNMPFVIKESIERKVALLILGTPLFATTHIELVLEAKERGIDVEIVHNASIQSTFGCFGLFSYSFGTTVSIPFFTDRCKPVSFYEKIIQNYKSGLHTLCLLDIKIREPTMETLMKREDKYYDRFMIINEAIEQIEESMKITNDYSIKEVKILGIERFGKITQKVHYGTIKELKIEKYGEPLHSLIVPSLENRIEKELVERFFKLEK